MTTDPNNWLEEMNHEGKPCWRNVRTFEICYTTPMCIAQLPAVPVAVWEKVDGERGVCFIHKMSGEVVQPFKPRIRTSEVYHRDRKRGPDLSMEISADETAVGKKVLEFSVDDLIERAGHMGSTRSIFDRKKFWRDFRLIEEGGEVVLKRVRNNEVMQRLSYYEAEIFSDNSHLQQVFANGRQLERMKRELSIDDRVAANDFTPRTPYQRRQGEAKTVEHWGQRKLLLSEVEFLTRHGDKAETVVYAGSAPGTHINYLSEVLFPYLHFILIDPAAFECHKTDKIEIRNTFFSDEIAKEFKDKDILFICDIRSMDTGTAAKARAGQVAQDMIWQEKWIREMKPLASMVKFTLPYTPPAGKTPYLDGEMFLPVFGGRTSTECRLVVTDPESTRHYDHEEYEAFMFHHNTITRTQLWDVPLPRGPRREVGLDRCFDCASEVNIVQQFLKKYRGFKEGSNMEMEVIRLCTEFSAVCSTNSRSLKIDH